MKKQYYIQCSVQCSDKYEEIWWAEGSCAFLNPDEISMNELLDFSDKMTNDFHEGRSDSYLMRQNPLKTISILEKDKMKILYSDGNSKTMVSKLGKVLDTIDLPDKEELSDFIIYRDDFP